MEKLGHFEGQVKQQFQEVRIRHAILEACSQLTKTKLWETQAGELILTQALPLFKAGIRFLGSEPEPAVFAIFNALYNLGVEHQNIELWCQEMLKGAALAAHLTDWLDFGIVVAWKNGLTALQEKAHSRILNLPSNLYHLIFSQSIERKELIQNPWWPLPKTDVLQYQMTLGGHKLQAGSFEGLPQLLIEGDTIWVSEGTRYWKLHLSHTGYWLEKLKALPKQAQGKDPLTTQEKKNLASPTPLWAELIKKGQIYCTQYSVLCTRPDSYHIFVFRKPKKS